MTWFGLWSHGQLNSILHGCGKWELVVQENLLLAQLERR